MKIKRSLMYKYAPQMKTYDRYAHDWKPYIMYSNTPNLKTEILNTDNLGLRFNGNIKEEFKAGNIFEQENNKKEYGAILGASTAFGLGASNDEMTISSLISKDRDIFFYNLGVSAFSGFQEVVLHQSLINYFDKIKYVVIFSGLNDWFLINYIDKFDQELGPYFYNNHFLSGMDNIVLNKKRKIAKFLFSPFLDNKVDWKSVTVKKIIQTFSDKNDLKKSTYDNSEKVKLLKKFLLRNLTYWSNIQKVYKIKLFYVLQPIPSWSKKNLSIEEKEIFKELDSNNSKAYNIERSLDSSSHEKYVGYLSELCNKVGINFIDSNKYLKENTKDNDWCFIDRSHLTDLGNKYISKLISSII